MPTNSPQNKAGRPQTWPSQIEVPSKVRALYQAIADLHDSDAFDQCHIWSGAMNGNFPVIKWKKKNQKVVQVLAGYMGLPTSKNVCGTKNCVNPFHYLPYAAPEAQLASESTVPIQAVTPKAALDDYIELVEFTLDEQDIKPTDATFDVLRPLIPAEDISDSFLEDVVTHLRGAASGK